MIAEAPMINKVYAPKAYTYSDYGIVNDLHVLEHKTPEPTGILDPYGHMIFKVRESVGYVRF